MSAASGRALPGAVSPACVSPAFASMNRRNTAPPGAGRYSAPSSSSPRDCTVGTSNAAISVALSVMPGRSGSSIQSVPIARCSRQPLRKTTRGPLGPLSDTTGFRCRRVPMRTSAKPTFRLAKKPRMEASVDSEKLVAGAGLTCDLRVMSPTSCQRSTAAERNYGDSGGLLQPCNQPAPVGAPNGLQAAKQLAPRHQDSRTAPAPAGPRVDAEHDRSGRSSRGIRTSPSGSSKYMTLHTRR